jgi:hypothetical protein
MTERDMTDALDGPFLDRLNSEYQNVKDHHVGRLLAAASGIGDPRYLHAALEFGAREMAPVLFQLTIAPDGALADRARAAMLYLHGAEQGWWKITAQNTERAGALVAAHYGEAIAEPETKAEPKPTKSRTKPHRAGQDETRRYLGIMRECQLLKAVLTDRGASNQAKLDAIEKWLQVLGWLAPDELRVAMEKIHDRA